MESYRVRDLAFPVSTGEVRNLDRMIGKSASVRKVYYRGHEMAASMHDGTVVLAFEYPLLKAFGSTESEELFHNSEENRFCSFVMEGEFQNLRRFFVSDAANLALFIGDRNARQDFWSWCQKSFSGRNIRLSSELPNSPQNCCQPFFGFAKQQCQYLGKSRGTKWTS